MNANLRQIEAFVEVARLGSFSRAAGRLHLSQAGLSILVRKLEGTLGVQLFERTTRNVVLSAAGREMLEAAERVVADVAALADAARGASRRSASRIALALPPRLAATRLPAALRRFAQDYPQVAVGFHECINEDMVARVSAREVDFGLGFGVEARSDIVREPIGEDVFMAACPADHPLARKRVLRWRDLAGEPLVTLPRASAARGAVERQFAACGQMLAPVYEANSLVALALAREGLGIAVVSAAADARAGRNDGLVFRILQEPRVTRPLMVVTRRGAVLSEAARALVARFAAQAGASSPRSQ